MSTLQHVADGWVRYDELHLNADSVYHRRHTCLTANFSHQIKSRVSKICQQALCTQAFMCYLQKNLHILHFTCKTDAMVSSLEENVELRDSNSVLSFSDQRISFALEK